MRLSQRITWMAGAIALAVMTLAPRSAGAKGGGRYYLPHGAAEKIVTATRSGSAQREILLMTQAVAVKETGPAATIKKFGEVYSFSPRFIAVHRDEPVKFTFWNLQPDDDHDFALLDRGWNVLMFEDLPPLTKTSYVLTFHREGLYDFKCLQHQPEMSGQILVLPPR
ncbi:MAG: cupredoxin domain-containing protein [Candidatus Binataceae bacterium]